MREIIKEARSVEEAIDLACKELGVERDAIDFEIINLPKRGFFGFRNTPEGTCDPAGTRTRRRTGEEA